MAVSGEESLTMQSFLMPMLIRDLLSGWGHEFGDNGPDLIRNIVEERIRSGNLSDLSYLAVRQAEEMRRGTDYLDVATPAFPKSVIDAVRCFALRINKSVNVVLLAIIIDRLRTEKLLQ